MLIIGAGLSGCLAGVMHPKSKIIDAGSGISSQHKAVLRFREDSIGHAIGVPFRRVRVRKAIVKSCEELPLTIRLANMYAMKVTGRVTERSITSLEPVERFVAPGDLHAILGDLCGNRISFGVEVDSLAALTFQRGTATPVISTIPMPALLKVLGIEVQHDFSFASIHVTRLRFPGCDVHQTIYFPGPETPVYRATLTGEDLIIEGISVVSDADRNYIKDSFYLPRKGGELVSEGAQRYGKINPLPDEIRKALLLKITLEHRIYSLGRFACWKNILMDDVYKDIHKIRAMAKLGSYDVIKEIM